MGRTVGTVVLVGILQVAVPSAGEAASASFPDAQPARGARASQPPPAPTPAPAPSSSAAAAERTRVRAQARERARAARGEAERGRGVDASGKELVKTFTGADADILELSNASGDIVVTGTRGSTGRIVVRVAARGRTEAEAQQMLAAFELSITQSAGRVRVGPAQPRPGGQMRLDYDVTLPQGMGLHLKNMSGDVTVRGVSGDVRVEAVSGNVLADSLRQVRLLRTMSGDIRLSKSTLDGDANLQTVSGDVMASTLQAATLTLGSISGNIRLADSVCEQANIRTVNGDIEFSSPAVTRGRYEIKTHAGNITVAPGTKTVGFVFEASTFSGNITSTADGERSGAERRPGTGRQLRGTVGDGAAFFDLTTFAGNIQIGK